MKILHVITTLYTGGAEKLMVDLLPRYVTWVIRWNFVFLTIPRLRSTIVWLSLALKFILWRAQVATTVLFV